MNSSLPSARSAEPFGRSDATQRPAMRIDARGLLFARATLAGIGLAGSLLVVYATRWGPWAYSDGVGYLMLARNVLQGVGLGLMRASGEFHPLSLHPPLFPLTLAALGVTGADLIQVARWLNAALFGVAIVLGGALVYLGSGRGWLASATSFALLFSPQLVYLFSGAMSEPMFFVLVLGSLLALQVYLGQRQRLGLLAAGIGTGLAILTRYPGVALLLPGIAAVVARETRGWKAKATDGALYLGLAGAPVFVWLGWVGLQPGADPPRQWNWDLTHLPSRVKPVIEGVGFALWDWLPFSGWAGELPTWVKQAVLGILVLAALGLGVLLVLRLRRANLPTWHRDPTVLLGLLLGTFAIAYLGQLTVTYLFSIPVLDPSDIDQRILAPILVVLVLSWFGVADLLRRSFPTRRWLAVVPGAVLLLYAGWFTPQTWEIAASLNREGAGYTSRTWRNSHTISALQALPAETPIITNESAAVMFWLDRPAYDFKLPASIEPGSALDRFGDGANELDRIFRDEGATLILFNSISQQLAGSYGQELAETRLAELTRGLELFAELDDGAVFFYPIGGSSG